ncbi:hypothetical protein JTE90_002805 [Oedothorax gibbosus]|uniref:BTB domain-containing protein n=1 Tax=Oedothorax gibbosus TaxID=931172 RepID=A0AAV6UFS7_9ARAC|nr:hypothetical protein JTE90_002805 [Oedothorax gibbosus]
MFIITSSCEIPMKSEPNHIFSIEKSLIVNSDKNSILNPKDTLTVGCRMRGETIETREYRMYSVIHKKKIQWIIEKFDSVSKYATIKETGNLLFFMTIEKISEERTYTLQVTGMPSSDGWNFFIWKLSLKDNKGIVLADKILAHLVPKWVWNTSLSALNENENLQMEFEAIVEVHTDSGSSVSSSLVEDLLHLHENNTLSDAIINAEGKSFPAHRSILAARSTVFRAMFEKEMTEGRSGVVDVNDVDAATMSKLLGYMYSDSLEGIQFAEAAKLLYAADKYDVQSLKLGCCDILIAGLTIDNACEALVLADRHSDDLMTRTMDFIGKRPELIASKMWDEMEETNLRIAAKVTRELYLMKAMK